MTSKRIFNCEFTTQIEASSPEEARLKAESITNGHRGEWWVFGGAV